MFGRAGAGGALRALALAPQRRALSPPIPTISITTRRAAAVVGWIPSRASLLSLFMGGVEGEEEDLRTCFREEEQHASTLEYSHGGMEEGLSASYIACMKHHASMLPACHHAALPQATCLCLLSRLAFSGMLPLMPSSLAFQEEGLFLMPSGAGTGGITHRQAGSATLQCRLHRLLLLTSCCHIPAALHCSHLHFLLSLSYTCLGDSNMPVVTSLLHHIIPALLSPPLPHFSDLGRVTWWSVQAGTGRQAGLLLQNPLQDTVHNTNQTHLLFSLLSLSARTFLPFRQPSVRQFGWADQEFGQAAGLAAGSSPSLCPHGLASSMWHVGIYGITCM